MGRLSENSVVSIKNKSFSVTAEIEVPDGGAEGVIIAQGGRFGGWAVYVKDGRAKFVYNVLGIQEFATEADAPVPEGTHQVRMEFAYDGGGLAKGGDVTLYYDGEPVGTGRVGATQPMIFSADETTDIGYESGTTVTPGLHGGDEQVHRQDPLGADRPRRRRPRPLHRPGGAAARGHGAAVSPVTDSWTEGVAMDARDARTTQIDITAGTGRPDGQRRSSSGHGLDPGRHLPDGLREPLPGGGADPQGQRRRLLDGPAHR